MKALLKILLFSFAPFFIYPWKPLVNIIAGESYSVALKYFKEGHVGAVNLAGHFVCLTFCILANFGLLALLDERILQPLEGIRLLSDLSALVWVGILVTSNAPKAVSVSSATMISLAYRFGPLIPKTLLEWCAVFGFVISIVATNHFAPSRERIKLPSSKWMPMALLPPGISYASQVFSKSSYAGSYVDNASVVSIGTLLFLALISTTPNPVKKVVVLGVFLCRIAFIFSGVNELFYLSCGFMSSLFQGLCHLITEEEATLISHGNNGGKDELAFEYAHVVYFPNIALETIYDKINQKSKIKNEIKTKMIHQQLQMINSGSPIYPYFFSILSA